MSATLWLWRHPAPAAALVQGRCLGRLDVAVDRRRAKRLAHRVRAFVRRRGLPHVVWTSPLARCADVGRWLRRFGFVHRVDADLCELDFGRWEGQRFADIAPAEIAEWEAAFMAHPPGGGESLQALLARVDRFVAGCEGPALVIAHAGWINALAWRVSGTEVSATAWPRGVKHGARVRFDVGPG